MPREKRPNFKVGDVVEATNVGISFHCESDRGVVIRVGNKKDWDFQVYWFSGENYHHWVDEMVWCGGMKYKKLCKKCEYRSLCNDLDFPKRRCNKCEYKSLCNHLQEMARCDISEFGQMRGEGKVDYDVCKQRKCKHLSLCMTARFIQK